MHIVHVTSELSPFAKVGGLGDVVYGLSEELCRLGHHNTVILPLYDHIDFSKLAKFQKIYSPTDSFNACLWSGYLEDILVILIESLDERQCFKRKSIYGEPDDVFRYVHFCLLAKQAIEILNISLDSLHLHDWPTAFLAPLIKWKKLEVRKQPHIVLTIHNIMHQGKCLPSDLASLPYSILEIFEHSSLRDPIHQRDINLLRSGIEYCDKLTTVSKTYAEEIQTPAYGFHLEEVIKHHQSKLFGILNGIDDYFWNPKKDPYLLSAFPPSGNAAAITKIKMQHRHHLQKYLGLHLDDAHPIFCSITRLDYQKTPELIAHAMHQCASKESVYITLGSPSSHEIDQSFQKVLEAHHSTNRLVYHKGFNEALAHQVFAAADFIVIPSRFEPCGLTQMIGMRYGAIPIVRRVGGLADTVIDLEIHQKSTGICFDELTTKALDLALSRAFSLYQNQEAFLQVRQRGMLQDFSWERSAKLYLKIYEA